MKNKSKLVDLPEEGTCISTAYRYPKAQAAEFNSRIESEMIHYPGCISNGSTAYSFHRGDNDELLITLLDGEPKDPAIPIHYVYAGQMTDKAFPGFYRFLNEMGYDEFEKPGKSPKSPKDNSDTIRTIVKSYDAWGGVQLRGVIVNPSYPWAPGHPKGSRFTRRRGLGSLLAALVAGAAVATLVSRLGRNR